MKPTITLLLLVISLSLHAQTFSKLINKADSLYDSKDYKASAKTYEKAFGIKEGNAGQYYNAACSWALSGDSLTSIHYLNLAANKGWKNKKWLKKDKDLQSLHSLKEWDDILEKVQKNLNEYEKNFDQPLKNRLEKIYLEDQTLRQLLSCARDKFGENSEEMEYLWNLISWQDSLNESKIVEIIEKHGWVGKSLVGGKANMTLWLVIQHAPLDIQEKYLPLLKESVNKGESSARHLALLEDRILMRKGEPQIYGSQVTQNPETGKYEVYQIKDPEYVNQRREKIGLGPIENYLKNWDIEWEVTQKKK